MNNQVTIELGQQPKQFIPMVVTIRIETAKEFMDLWHRMNISNASLSGVNSTSFFIPYLGINNQVWNALNSMDRDRSIIKEFRK